MTPSYMAYPDVVLSTNTDSGATGIDNSNIAKIILSVEGEYDGEYELSAITTDSMATRAIDTLVVDDRVTKISVREGRDYNEYSPLGWVLTRELVIGSNVADVGRFAYSRQHTGNPSVASQLTTIYFKGTPVSVSSAAFPEESITDIYVPWSKGEVANAPWGATNAMIHYNYTYTED